MNTLAWIGLTQSLFAAVLMFTKKSSSLPDKILSGWLTLLAIEFLTCGLDHSVYGEPLLSSSFLLFNPALFIYVSALTRDDFKLKKSQLLHLLPFITFELIAYSISEPFNPETFFKEKQNFWFKISFSVVNILSWMIYNPLSLLMVHRHRISLKEEHSNIEKNENLGWLLSVAIFYVVYCVFALVVAIIGISTGMDYRLPHIFNYSAMLVLVFMLSFYGLRQQELKNRYLTGVKNLKSYQNSNLSDSQKEIIRKKIIRYVETEKAYLQSDLNMEMLANAIHIQRYQVTEVLNTTLGMNFFQFINGYRVEAVKKMLAKDGDKYSIEAIGYDCGFSSKSVFFAVFKKETGMTPKEYWLSLGLFQG
jgi:AraC-like DNA-binding protein